MRPNGVLVTQNRGKGIRFTRMRLLYRREARRPRLQDGGLPQAVDDRRHAGPANPGADRRAQRRARADPGQVSRRLGDGRSAGRRLRKRGRPDVRVEGREHRDRCDAHALRHRLRDHELRWAAGRPHLPDGGQPGRLLPGLHAAAVPDHPRAVVRRPALRQRDHDAPGERRRAEVDARERRLDDAGGAGPLPAGVRALLHLQHHEPRRKPSGLGGETGGGRDLHGPAGRPHGRRRPTTSPPTTSSRAVATATRTSSIGRRPARSSTRPWPTTSRPTRRSAPTIQGRIVCLPSAPPCPVVVP